MNTLLLPPADEMYRALLERDHQYEGVFFVGVKTTGIFCRPSCPARKPKIENIQFYRTTGDALAAGFRACKRCKPLEVVGAAPDWIQKVLELVESDPTHRWTDAELRTRDLNPVRIRRWFKQHHNMTFQTYQRTRRLSVAMGQISVGDQVTHAALDSGYQSLSGFRDAYKKWAGKIPQAARTDRSPIVANRILTPLGPMVAAATDDGLCLLEFADRRMLETQFQRLFRLLRRPLVSGEHELISQAAVEIGEYFDGNRAVFDVPLDIRGSEFQENVWRQLLEIPLGQTCSYENIAATLGKPRAQRAVGRANGDNRLAIVVPCHRVIRSDGTLSGYGGGVCRKKWLLAHEQKIT